MNRIWHKHEDPDYRPDCWICLDACDSCIACDRTHSATDPIERAELAWRAQQEEVNV